MRIYSNYSNSEVASIKKEADEINMSLSGFQKYCVELYVKSDPAMRKNTIPIFNLKKILTQSLLDIKPGTTFIVSSLFKPEVWSNLSRSEKRILADDLTKYVDSHPEFIVVKRIRGTIKQYKKI
ncbi:MAG: DUF1413 domain-containing protein [Ruminiclostridium sp.]|nr:DUF1413 domain-containing protein [Ruminiclostridium sp.]